MRWYLPDQAADTEMPRFRGAFQFDV